MDGIDLRGLPLTERKRDLNRLCAKARVPFLRQVESFPDGAFLSFICTVTAIEALGSFARPKEDNGPRFREFVKDYFPDPYPAHADDLWKFRNTMVHGFSPGPYGLTHHKGQCHLTMKNGQTVLNAEDFYGALLCATQRYFKAGAADITLQAALVERTKDPKTGVMVVVPLA